MGCITALWSRLRIWTVTTRPTQNSLSLVSGLGSQGPGVGGGSRYSFCPLLCVHPLSSSYRAGPCRLLATTLWHCQSLGIHCALHPGQNPSLYGISNQPESEWRELRNLLVSDFKDTHMEAEAGGVRAQEMLKKIPNLNNMQKQRAFTL